MSSVREGTCKSECGKRMAYGVSCNHELCKHTVFKNPKVRVKSNKKELELITKKISEKSLILSIYRTTVERWESDIEDLEETKRLLEESAR